MVILIRLTAKTLQIVICFASTHPLRLLKIEVTVIIHCYCLCLSSLPFVMFSPIFKLYTLMSIILSAGHRLTDNMFIVNKKY